MLKLETSLFYYNKRCSFDLFKYFFHLNNNGKTFGFLGATFNHQCPLKGTKRANSTQGRNVFMNYVNCFNNKTRWDQATIVSNYLRVYGNKSHTFCTYYAQISSATFRPARQFSAPWRRNYHERIFDNKYIFYITFFGYLVVCNINLSLSFERFIH